MEKVIEHIIVGGEVVPNLAPLFPYIHGVVSVSVGKLEGDKTPILDIAFDTFEVSGEKLLTAIFASALTHNTASIVIYNADVSNILTEDIPEVIRTRVRTEPLREFTLETVLQPIPFPITGILAKPSEASPFQLTNEGAQKALRDTKRALLNLLEDAREAEETVRKQADNLKEALEKTRALADARANFISTASHQLRTPLTSMRWFTEMLMNGDAGTLTSGAHDYVVQIDQGIARMVSLVNFLLRTARIESKRVAINPVPLRIHDAILHAIELKQSLLDNKSQMIEIKEEADLTISLDPEFLNEVLVNLLENASHYSPEKTTTTVYLTEKDGTVRIDVADRGIGIKASDAPRVFEKFFRSGDAITVSPDGSGLGLSYAQAIVDEWGGKIWFANNPGGGTIFSFTIPLTGMMAQEGEVRLSE